MDTMGEMFRFNFGDVDDGSSNYNDESMNHSYDDKNNESSSIILSSSNAENALHIRYIHSYESYKESFLDDENLYSDDNFDSIELKCRIQDRNEDGNSTVDQVACHTRLYYARDALLNKVTPDASTDIIAGTYEGGLKVWECSIDLCRYLFKNYCYKSDSGGSRGIDGSLHKSMTVLELGCGHGLPGCLLLKQEHLNASVLFSDFNDYVIEHATMNNVRVNCKGIHNVEQRVAFASGDWLNLSKKLTCSGNNFEDKVTSWDVFGDGKVVDGKFDLILAAETTYTPSSAEATALLLKNHLISPGGCGIVANKRYYFGCGGGSDIFIHAIANVSMNQLKVETIEVFDSGSGNIRELFRITWK